MACWEKRLLIVCVRTLRDGLRLSSIAGIVLAVNVYECEVLCSFKIVLRVTLGLRRAV